MAKTWTRVNFEASRSRIVTRVRVGGRRSRSAPASAPATPGAASLPRTYPAADRPGHDPDADPLARSASATGRSRPAARPRSSSSPSSIARASNRSARMSSPRTSNSASSSRLGFAGRRRGTGASTDVAGLGVDRAAGRCGGRPAAARCGRALRAGRGHGRRCRPAARGAPGRAASVFSVTWTGSLKSRCLTRHCTGRSAFGSPVRPSSSTT